MIQKQKMKKPIFTSKAPAALGPYSQAVQWGDVVFISGQIPLNPENGEINNATFEDETNQVLDCLLYTSPSPRDRTRSRMPSSA